MIFFAFWCMGQGEIKNFSVYSTFFNPPVKISDNFTSAGVKISDNFTGIGVKLSDNE